MNVEEPNTLVELFVTKVIETVLGELEANKEAGTNEVVVEEVSIEASGQACTRRSKWMKKAKRLARHICPPH